MEIFLLKLKPSSMIIIRLEQHIIQELPVGCNL